MKHELKDSSIRQIQGLQTDLYETWRKCFVKNFQENYENFIAKELEFYIIWFSF